jgi:hypothetical protein
MDSLTTNTPSSFNLWTEVKSFALYLFVALFTFLPAILFYIDGATQGLFARDGMMIVWGLPLFLIPIAFFALWQKATGVPINMVELLVVFTITTIISVGLIAPSGNYMKPSNTKAPAIKGLARVGQTLQADPGHWNHSRESDWLSGNKQDNFNYQWESCSQSSCHTIQGANASTFTARPIDKGHSLRVRVTAKSLSGGYKRDAVSKPLPIS